MRLIDADEIKEWIENWFTKNRYYHPYAKGNNIPITELYDILEQIPTVDAVPVIRCKDCKNWDTTWKNDWLKNHYYCPMVDGIRAGDWFCADAERKEE